MFSISINMFKKNSNKYIQKQNLYIGLIKCTQIIIKKLNRTKKWNASFHYKFEKKNSKTKTIPLWKSLNIIL
jgi:hypothetical protein